ncbi:uncharacterized protein TRAVEDRAFT_43812 [Trametes versicolor FP-101664 SS1]|uniref:uncharacterized protein n=1 Tax=Trametes versicolor (strain FP-101664) TaxID=717944 RepID=UPI00046240FD|nr:uncharacterized protein TRAVEDRAFT_43812 [Trametes versicolor FP-101664 SS1]EIW63526.1 hypothetical protein TRAVEDRAFT_43812 [Trametes versicolor FP-101664 SS1]
MESYEGTPLYHPLDTSCGEYDYNPFAYDVACLGNLYRIHFSTIVPTIPLLAPLFDKMTTHVAAERFTAVEAASFIEFAIASVPEPALVMLFTLRTEWESFENPDLYWARTTPEFRDHWAHFRAPRLPWISLLLMRLLESPKGWPMLCFHDGVVVRHLEFNYCRRRRHLQAASTLRSLGPLSPANVCAVLRGQGSVRLLTLSVNTGLDAGKDDADVATVLVRAISILNQLRRLTVMSV